MVQPTYIRGGVIIRYPYRINPDRTAHVLLGVAGCIPWDYDYERLLALHHLLVGVCVVRGTATFVHGVQKFTEILVNPRIPDQFKRRLVTQLKIGGRYSS